MAYYDSAKLLVEMAKGLFGLREKLAEAHLARRNRTADLLDKVAGCIEEIAAADFGGDLVIHKCNELKEYRRSLADIVADQVSAIDRERIQGWLESSVSARGVLFAPQEAGSYAAAKEMFAEAAGRLRALSNLLRV
jgi:hypothetical protein